MRSRHVKKINLIAQGRLLAALVAWSMLLPGQALAQGYPTTAWSQVTPAVVSEAGYRAGFGTGVTLAGETVELRPGSPFVKIGDRLVQLTNVPFQRDGEFRVPNELFADEAFMKFAPQIRPLIQTQEIQLMLSAPWGPKP